MVKKKAIFITGGTGYLGQKLVKSLGDKYAITLYDNSGKCKDIFPHISSCSFDDIAGVFEKEKFEYVLHLSTVYGRKNESALDIYKGNVEFPSLVLELAIKNGVKFWINTDTSLNPEVSTYSRTKKDFLGILKNQNSKIVVVNMVLEHFVGFQDGTFVSKIIESMINNQKDIPMTNGYQKRDFVSVLDVVQAYLCVLDSISLYSKLESRRYFEYPVGTGKSYSIRDLIQIIFDVLPECEATFLWGHIPLRSFEKDEYKADISQLNSLGWTPKFTLRQLIEEIVYKMRNP